ncbi:sigma-70 family RNA polymerase sigma factor [Aequorivita sp. F47161]|uniref:Sigma-70 family RNA polymerase sigma factor n=1 Tax=Aequorivita vitellina TaxID=2874475 RepID=A0A9X1U0W1_9FLAO|nr:sigma-70 family RNA polymerase sigma factor [Aequorivita vitellina]MCG2418145.1 sigma-70 family RNA polymerase sigma factor [Aequorivita vitellina]MCZ4318029.1 sigma-70 family RNA polymerase sigma factor [Aequorivita viscosa]
MEITPEEISHQLEKAKKGKQSAFKFLLDYYWNEVYGFQLKRVRNEHEAEDITIETFAKAFDKIDSFDEKYTFSTWLVTISKNIQIDRTRKKNASIYSNTTDASNEHVQRIADHAPTPEDKLIREQNLAELLQYIKLLKPHYQEVINLRYFQEMSYNEISETLEEPLNNVKVRLLRARKLLAEIITQKD